MKQKFEYMTKGYILTFINLALILSGYPALGIIFGAVSVVYFIKALRIKQ
jgi:hypothetical protein